MTASLTFVGEAVIVLWEEGYNKQVPPVSSRRTLPLPYTEAIAYE